MSQRYMGLKLDVQVAARTCRCEEKQTAKEAVAANVQVLVEQLEQEHSEAFPA